MLRVKILILQYSYEIRILVELMFENNTWVLEWWRRKFCHLHWFGGGKRWFPEPCSSDSQLIWSWFLFVRPRRLMGKFSKNNWPRDSACPLLVILGQSKAGCCFFCSLLNANSALLPLLNWCFDFFLAKLAKSTLSKMFVVCTCCMFPVVSEIVAMLQTLLQQI